jgi:hypothetical protein
MREHFLFSESPEKSTPLALVGSPDGLVYGLIARKMLSRVLVHFSSGGFSRGIKPVNAVPSLR